MVDLFFQFNFLNIKLHDFSNLDASDLITQITNLEVNVFFKFSSNRKFDYTFHLSLDLTRFVTYLLWSVSYVLLFLILFQFLNIGE